jgi:hypothetical protein
MSRIKDLQKQVIKVLNDTEEPAKAMPIGKADTAGMTW